MDPFDIVKSIVPTLSDKQKKEIADLLNIGPCQRNGHKFKKVGEGGTFWKGYIISVCTCCGEEKRTAKD